MSSLKYQYLCMDLHLASIDAGFPPAAAKCSFIMGKKITMGKSRRKYLLRLNMWLVFLQVALFHCRFIDGETLTVKDLRWPRVDAAIKFQNVSVRCRRGGGDGGAGCSDHHRRLAGCIPRPQCAVPVPHREQRRTGEPRESPLCPVNNSLFSRI